MTIYECRIILSIHIVTCIFIIEFVYEPLDFIKGELVYRGFLEYVVNTCASWFLMKGATLKRGRCFLKNLCTIMHLAEGIKKFLQLLSLSHKICCE
jgi:hypothetical protein